MKENEKSSMNMNNDKQSTASTRQQNKKEMSAGKAIAVFAGVSVFIAAVIIAVVVYVDPFFHYHAPLSWFPYVVDNQLSQNPGMARNMTYDSCIIGSSMTVNFDTDDFAEVLGLDTLKLSYSGAYPHDDYNILSIVYDEDSLARQTNDVTAVFLGLDIPTLTADEDEIKYELPEYLYDANVLNDVQYVLNKDVLLEYVLRPLINNKPTDLSEVYFSWWTPEYYNIQWVMHGYEAPEAVEEEMDADTLIPQTATNLDVNIIPFIEEHPETTFYIFYPPYSVLYWNNVMVENHLEATMNQYQYTAERLLEYDNVRLFYFQNMEDVVTDLNNYADYTHYKPEINSYMVNCFGSGEHEVTSADQMAEELEEMRRIIDEFDYDSLFAVEW